jgi:hypothetical protein
MATAATTLRGATRVSGLVSGLRAHESTLNSGTLRPNLVRFTNSVASAAPQSGGAHIAASAASSASSSLRVAASITYVPRGVVFGAADAAAVGVVGVGSASEGTALVAALAVVAVVLADVLVDAGKPDAAPAAGGATVASLDG